MTQSTRRTKRARRPPRPHRLTAELRNLGLCLAAGLIVIPCLIWIIGRGMLGPYTNGGLFALWLDFGRGLLQGSAAFWAILLGPYLFLNLVRGGHYLLTR